PRRADSLGDADILDVEPRLGEVDGHLDPAILERLAYHLDRAGEEFRHVETHGRQIARRNCGSKPQDRRGLGRSLYGYIGFDPLNFRRPAQLVPSLVCRECQLAIAKAVAL